MFPADHWWLIPLLAMTLAALAWLGFACVRPRMAAAVRPCRPAAGVELRRWRAVQAVPVGLAVLVAAAGSAAAAWLTAAPVGGDSAVSEVISAGARLHPVFDELPLARMPAALPGRFLGEIAAIGDAVDRDWDKLDPRFRQRLELVLGKLQQRGHGFMLIEGYRSPERQSQLFEQPVRVTFARAWQSRHQFGLAADLAPTQGSRLVDGDDAGAMEAYRALGEEAEAAGLTWGGRWAFRDYGHVEMQPPRPSGKG